MEHYELPKFVLDSLMKCKVCGEEKRPIELTADDICISCHLALGDKERVECSWQRRPCGQCGSFQVDVYHDKRHCRDCRTWENRLGELHGGHAMITDWC
jgi:hypothetical protein